MRIFCSICKELFIPYSEINATSCGHLYHGACILRWLKQHKTCPQCRSSVSSPPIRVYFDVDKDNEIDASTLEHQLEAATSELRQSRIDIKLLREKNENIEKTLSELEESSAATKRKNQILKSSVQALKDQINTLNNRIEKNGNLKAELEALRSRMKAYENLDEIINSTAEEANKLLKITPVTEFGLRQLSIYASALKDKTQKDNKKLAELTQEKKELQKALATEQMKKSCEGDYAKLKQAFEALKVEHRFTKDLLECLTDKWTKRENENLIHTRPQVPNKRSPFTVNTDLLDSVEPKVKRSSCSSDVAESIKHWEDLVAAGPSQNARFAPVSSRVPGRSEPEERAHSNYAFDGMGGRKKICLGHATPQDEFNKIKTDNKITEKLSEKNKKEINFKKKSLDSGKHKLLFGYLGSNERKN